MKSLQTRLGAALLAAVLAVSVIIPAAAAPATFSDVPSNAWYAQDVADVQKYGIINGMGENRFAPDGLLTVAQAITMAARACACLKGETIPENVDHDWVDPDTWYAPYMAYAMDNGIVPSDSPISPSHINDPCTRVYMAEFFAIVAAKQDNVILNDIQTIPDVPDETNNKSIYYLYRYGILTGSDKYGSFYPMRSITRAETAAILNRLLDVDKRKSFKLEPKPALTEKQAISLAFSYAKSCGDLDPVVTEKNAEIIDFNNNAFLIGLPAVVWYEGEWFGEAEMVYWVHRYSEEVRYMFGLQDYYVPGMIDLDSGTVNEGFFAY